jgi:hypothetical protein
LRRAGFFAGRLRTSSSQKDIFQMTIKDNVHAALPSGRTPPISAQNLRDAIDLVIDYVPTVAGTGGGGGGTVVTGNAATFDTMATLQAATVDPAINYVRTAGYYAIGDLGGGVYRRKQSVEPTYELDRTSNGGTVRWELIPERMEIWFNSAGARSPTNYNVQDNDCYPCFRAIDKFAAAKGLAGYTLRLDSNVYFSSKAWHFKRITTKVKGTANGSSSGQGTILRFPVDQCGLITNYKWGMGHDYMMTLGNWAFDPANPQTTAHGGRGVCVYSGAGGGVPDGSCYRVVQGGISPSTGAAAITSVTPGVDITWGTIKLRYDGNIITDPVPGGGTMDYDCGADDNHSAGGCRFEDLEIWGYWHGSDPVNWKWKHNNAGIVMRVRGHISNVFTLGFAGHGIAVVADGDPDVGGPGNANGTYVEHCASYWNGKDGFHFGYSNGNCVVATCLDVSGNGRWGIADWTFLGNSITGVEAAYDGRGFGNSRQYFPQCQYQGWVYMARLPMLGSSDVPVNQGWPSYINENPTTCPWAWIKYYKCNDDFVNAEQVIASTSSGGGAILGAAVSGKQTLTAAGAHGNDIIFYKITDGANWEIGIARFFPAGYDAGTPADVVGRSVKAFAAQSGGVIASSLPLSANGTYPLLTLTPSATLKAFAVAANYDDCAYWTPEIQFEPAGAYSGVTIAARSVWNYIYIEGGSLPAQWCWPTAVLGGMLNTLYDRSRGVFAIDDGKLTTVQAFGTELPLDNSALLQQFTSLGTGGGDVLSWTNFNNRIYDLRHTHTNSGNGYAGTDLVLDDITIGKGQYNPLIRFRGPGSGTLYGRSSDGDWGGPGNQPTQITQLVIGNNTSSDGRLVQMGGAAPTSGYHAKGEFVLNDGSGSDNTTFLWRCTASGNPGTWVGRT